MSDEMVPSRGVVISISKKDSEPVTHTNVVRNKYLHLPVARPLKRSWRLLWSLHRHLRETREPNRILSWPPFVKVRTSNQIELITTGASRPCTRDVTDGE